MSSSNFDAPIETATCIEAEPFALRVTDDSMEPEFQCGCIVIVDPTGRVKDGAFVLAELEDGFIFRQLSLGRTGAQLEALNADYPSTPVDVAGGAIKGVIVQRAGPRRRYHKRYD